MFGKGMTPPQRRTLTAAILAGMSVLPTAVMAEQIALRSDDGAIDFTGDFVRLDDGSYVVRTALGDLRVKADRVGCEGAACPDAGSATADVRFAGSNTFGLGLMPLLLEGYAAHLDAEVSIASTDNEILADYVGAGGFGDGIGSFLVNSTLTGDAFEALRSDTAHFGMSSRRIEPAEARTLRNANAGNMISPDQEHIIAIDSLVVVTNPSNPVQKITMAQLRDVYAGRIRNWSELGGDDLPIRVIDRQTDSGTRSAFYDAIFGKNTPSVRVAKAAIAETNSDAARMVNEDASAIGYVGYAFQRGAKPLTLVNECGMSTEPDAFSARVEEYGLQRRLYLYNRAGDLPQEARDFLSYATSEDADAVISKAGFIDLGIKRKAQDLNGPRARMLLDPNVDNYEGGVMRQMLAEMVEL